VARHGYAVHAGESVIGRVTSGTQTPFIKKSIGMAYVPIGYSTLDTEMSIDVRGRRVGARVVRMPFYTRPRS
jgi:aminomethyltransferase